MHIYKREDGAFVIDFEGDLLVSNKEQIRFSDFGAQDVVMCNGFFAVNNNYVGSRFKRAMWALRQCLKRV